MSRPTDWIVGTLDPDRVEKARQRAERQSTRYDEDRGDFAPYLGMPREERLFQAQAAREFVAQELGRASVPHGVKVHWTPEPARRARAKVPPDATQRLWVLVAGRADDGFQIVTALTPAEAADIGTLKRDVPRPAYYVPASKLPAPIPALLVYKIGGRSA